jgi:hypothetical protein
MVKSFDVLLDLEKELYNPSTLLFSVSRNDFNTIQINFIITQDGTPIDLTNKTVELAVKKPSGLTVYQDCEIKTAIEGKAQIELNQQAYIEYGIYTAEVYIREGTEIAVTCAFWYQSKSSIFNEDTEEAIESIDDWSALQKALFAYDLKPILVEGFPTITPEYVGQMAFDTINEIAYIATDLSSADWRTFGTGEGGGVANDTIFGDNPINFTPARIGQIFIDEINEDAYIAIGVTANDWEQINNEDFVKQAITWAEVLDKPTTFTPEEHGHEIVEVFGLQDAIDSKAEFSHSHDWAEINNKPLTFVPEAHSHDWAEIDNKPTTFTPDNHNHEIGEINGLQASLNSKADESDLTTKANVADVYTKLETYSKPEVDTIVTGITEGGGTIVEDNLNSNSTSSALSANQGRILNETKADINHSHNYAPDSHSHIIQEIEGLQSELDSKADINHNHTYAEILDKPTTFTPEAHTHLKAEITDFAHNHDWGEITDKPTTFTPEIHSHTWGEITGKPTTFQPSAHNHVIGEITGLQGELDSKAEDVHTHTKADIIDFAHNHDWAEIDNKPIAFTPEAHTHNWVDIQGKPTTFTPEVHNHAWGEITGKPTTFTPEAHNHEIGEINGLQASLNSKADESDLGGLKLWSGTQAEYDAIGSKDNTTLYFVTG